MTNSNTFGKTICSICYEHLEPIVEDLQAISNCGHVFHELCLQQWFEYCASTKGYSCPVCKQSCKGNDVGRLYFQSLGDSAELTQRPIVESEEDSEALRQEVKRLEAKALGLGSALERQGKNLKELTEELCLCKDQAKKEVALKNEALKQQAHMQQLLHMKSEELDKSTLKCSELKKRNMALAQELAAFKLGTDINLNEEEVLELAMLGNEACNKGAINTLRKSLMVHKSYYKELMDKYTPLKKEAERLKEAKEKAKEKILKLKKRVRELEIAAEVKDNEVLRALKASKKIRGERVIQKDVNCNSNSVSVNNLSEDQRKHLYAPKCSLDRIGSLHNDLLFHRRTEGNFTNHMDINCTIDGTSATAHDKERGAYTLLHDDASKYSSTKRGHSNPNPKEQPREGNQNSTLLRSEAVSDTKKETSVLGLNNLVEHLGSITGTCNETSKTPATDIPDVVILDDVKEAQPMLNIRRESPIPPSLPRPDTGDVCFSGGLLGPDGSNRYLGKWCKRAQNKGSVTRQDSSTDTGNLIAEGADGRGGRIKVLRSLNQSPVDNKENSPGTKRCKFGAKTISSQSQGCLQIEHFFGRAGN